jgi:hypothetical protein
LLVRSLIRRERRWYVELSIDTEEHMISISWARASSFPESRETRLRVHASPFRVGALWLAAAASASLACSDNDNPAAGSGGSVGGQTSRAGSAGASAGGTSAGGTSAGGTSAGGSSAGGTGIGQTPLGTFDFAADIEGWVFVYAEPPTLIATAATPTGDAGVDAGPPAPPEGVATATHDAAVGDPLGNPGSVLLQLPFSGPAQKIEFEGNVDMGGTGLNLAGRSISARVKVDAGLTADPMNPGGVKIYVKTGPTSLYADSAYINILPGGDWQTFTWANVSNASYVATPGVHTPTDVRQIGLEFDTGGAGLYTAATIHLDSVSY